MKSEVCHTIRHLKRTFDSDQWAEYCKECRHDEKKQIRTTIGKYIWNDFDICLNPEREEVTVKGGAYGYSATIKYAHCGNGVWAFGVDYNTGTGGGGFGVAWADKADTKLWNKGFESERECKKYAWRYILTYLQSRKSQNKMIARLYDEVEKKYKQYSRPQIVQLELFG